MATPAVSQLLTEQLLKDASDGLDVVVAELIELYDDCLDANGDTRAADRLATAITRLGWWSGRLLGGIAEDPAAWSRPSPPPLAG